MLGPTTHVEKEREKLRARRRKRRRSPASSTVRAGLLVRDSTGRCGDNTAGRAPSTSYLAISARPFQCLGFRFEGKRGAQHLIITGLAPPPTSKSSSILLYSSPVLQWRVCRRIHLRPCFSRRYRRPQWVRRYCLSRGEGRATNTLSQGPPGPASLVLPIGTPG
jgi:hypothetical protein